MTMTRRKNCPVCGSENLWVDPALNQFLSEFCCEEQHVRCSCRAAAPISTNSVGVVKIVYEYRVFPLDESTSWMLDLC